MMKKNMGSFRNSGPHTSPGTPEQGDNNDVGQIPNSRRHISVAALMPFNSGRTLPSKWDDAERWITSPISSYGVSNDSFDQQKSKSGPLTLPVHGNVSNFMASSPLSTGVLVSEGLSIHYDAGIDAEANSLYVENDLARSISVQDFLSESSVPSSLDDKVDGVKEEEGEVVSRVVSKRDMATQMSHGGSTRSSSKRRLSFSSLLCSRPNSVRLQSNPADKDEIRDVQVDKGTSTSSESKKQGLQKTTTKKDTSTVEGLPSRSDSEASRNTSKLQSEVAKITAWENLHKEKAEAAIKKLEMKLEKERSKSMDKILNKLRTAEEKAQTKRDLLSENDGPQTPRTSHRRISCCIYPKNYSLGNCSICHRN